MKRIITILKLSSQWLILKLFWVFPIDSRKVVFSSYRGRKYSDNPRAISQVLENNENVDVVWVLENEKDAPPKCRVVKPNTIKFYYEIATAKVWVDNCRKELWVSKRKKQFYIQTWHANLSGKKVEADAQQTLRKSYLMGAMRDSKMADLFISGSKWETSLYRSSFYYKGEILECGMPRADIFYADNKSVIDRVRQAFDISEEYKIVLYAPTFRQNKSVECYNMDYHALLKWLVTYWGGKWKMIVRLHPNIADRQELIEYDDEVINGSTYQDINEIIIASSLLITDYSSCMFEALEAQTPVIRYASDMELYRLERGSYFQDDDLPFIICKNNDQLKVAVQQFDIVGYKVQANDFLEKCGVFQCGDASLQIAKRILQELSYE